VKKTISSRLLAFAIAAASSHAMAIVPAEEASKLKSTLTPFGAEKAANAAGTIPAWDGGYTKAAAGYKNGDKRPDPFAAEKPVLTITGKNADQYASKLAEGTRFLLKKYPDYRVDVYPTHRTAAAPQWVYDNTFKNATRASVDSATDKIDGAYGGIPFPIPKNGAEVLWNHRLAWHGTDTYKIPSEIFLVTPNGGRVRATKSVYTVQMPYYFQEGSLEKFDGVYYTGRLLTEEPSSKAGEGVILQFATDPDKRAAWQYLVGQRRVRRAPNLAYDTPDFVTSGVAFFDEIFMVLGPHDRHDLKLVGKKELYVPYNANRAQAAPVEQLMKPGFLNPDLVRWELHRVWVVEATLKPGKRHVVAKRVFYVDDDSWQVMLADGWDAQGQLWRHQFSLPLLAPELPALTVNQGFGSYNLQTGAYYINQFSGDTNQQYVKLPRQAPTFFTPDAMANDSAR
jgi:hypothetical protein